MRYGRSLSAKERARSAGGSGSGIGAEDTSGLNVHARPGLAATVGLPLGMLLAVVFLGGLLDAPGDTAKTVLVPDLAELARVARDGDQAGVLDEVARRSGHVASATELAWLQARLGVRRRLVAGGGRRHG